MAYPILHGCAQDKTGNALEAVTVKIYETGTTTFESPGGAITSGTLIAETTTDELGRWMAAVDAGTYDVEYSGDLITTYSQEAFEVTV